MNIFSISDASTASMAGVGSATAASALPGMDGNDFMLLLLAQLKHQNPLEPMDDSQMMAQFTQLNSLEQLQQINLSLQALLQENQLSEAANLIGKSVELSTGESGVVTGVSMQNGQVMLWLGENQAPLSAVIRVVESEAQ